MLYKIKKTKQNISNRDTLIVWLQSKSVHKEELTMSATERAVQRDIQINARLMQKRRTNERLQLHDGKGGGNDKVGETNFCPPSLWCLF